MGSPALGDPADEPQAAAALDIGDTALHTTGRLRDGPMPELPMIYIVAHA